MLDFKNKNLIIIISLIVVFLIGFYAGANSGKSRVASNSDEITFLDEEIGTIKVYITGEINKSEVYELKESSRLEDLIKEAGGLTEDADISGLNLARRLKDGESINIPSKVQPTELGETQQNNLTINQNIFQKSGKTVDGKININYASKSELMELPGIGEVKSQAIIDYREENGQFVTIDDIIEVPGIGDKTFEKIKEKITID